MPAPPDRSETVLTVSALNRSVRDLLESRIPLLWVSGELSNFTAARSGHWYFSLKDDAAQVRCVMFRSRGQHVDWTPREGDHVEARVLVTLYEPRGDFQLMVEFMRRAGQGALYEAFLRLKARLEREGLFDEALKRPLPPFPRAIGVITSTRAAALHDVLTTLARRNPSIPVVLYPAGVQGDAAPGEIVEALARAGARNECDVLLLVRGGGSIEDLWAFNDERVARAIRACPIPVVCGVGHETDVTIADFAADRRAPTPTAAAVAASPSREELLAQIGSLATRLTRCLQRHLDTRVQLFDHLARRLVHPGRRLEERAAHVAHLGGRLARAHAASLERCAHRLARAESRLAAARPRIDALAARLSRAGDRLQAAAARAIDHREARLARLAQSLVHLDPHAVLARGYAIVADAQGAIVRDARVLAAGATVGITLARGGAVATVERTHDREPGDKS
jgi:exodeoxyribonuclease VII large subunit